VKITDKRAPVSAIAGRINEYLAPINRPEVSAIAINEWLVSEGYINTINDKGKNRKVTTDKGISIGIITEIRKVGVERVRVNMFDRKAQELVVAKFCGTEGFGENYTGLTEIAQELCERFLAESTVIPELTQYPKEEQTIECDAPPLDEHGVDVKTLSESDDSIVTPDMIRHPDEEQAVENEVLLINEHGAEAETLPSPVEPIEPVNPSRTILSIIADALKSLGKIFSRR